METTDVRREVAGMSRNVLRTAGGLFIVALICTAAAFSATAKERDSAFAGGVGASLVRLAESSGTEVQRILAGPAALDLDPHFSPSNSLLAVIGPQNPYSEAEAQAMQEFLQNGGTLLVADDFGQGNSLTSRLGVTFERVRLVEPDLAHQQLVRLQGRDYRVTLEAPTALQIDEESDTVVMATSSGHSFLDRDGTGVIDSGDPPGPFPLVAVTEIGVANGRLITVSDTRPFLGGEDQDNEAFLEGLLDAYLPVEGKLLVDESHSRSKDPILASAAIVVQALRSGPWPYIIVTVAILGAVVTMIAGPPYAWARHRFKPNRYVARADLREGPNYVISAQPHPKMHASEWTTRGRFCIFGGVSLALIGISQGNTQVAFTGALMLCAAALALWYTPTYVTAIRAMSTNSVQEDGIVQIDLQIDTRARSTSYLEIRDHLPTEFKLTDGESWFQTTLSRRSSVWARYEVRPAVRGPYIIGPLVARTSDPFHIRGVHTNVAQAQELMVHPRHDPLSRIPFRSKVAAMTLGPHLVNRAGDGSEFHALRNYETGDSIRSINWKASARSKDLVVNQRVHESMATLTIFLDSRTISAAGSVQSSPINEACRAALSIATGAMQARDRIKIFAYGDGIQDIAPGKGADQIHRLTQALAALPARGDMRFSQALENVLPALKPRTPFVLISGLEDDETIVDGIALLRQRDILPTVLIVPPGTKAADGDQDAEPDADRINMEHERAIERLRGLAIPTVPVKPGMPLAHSLRVGLT